MVLGVVNEPSPVPPLAKSSFDTTTCALNTGAPLVIAQTVNFLREGRFDHQLTLGKLFMKAIAN